MDDEADLKKILEVLSRAKEEQLEEFHHQEFISSDESDNELDNPPNYQDFSLEQPFQIDLSNIYKHNPIYSFTPDEKAVIDSCEDPDLKKLLILNRQKKLQLSLLYKKFNDLCIESKQNIINKDEIIRHYLDAFLSQRQSSRAWMLGAPYFKTKTFSSCPPNCDTVKKNNNKELSYFDLIPLTKWNKNECNKLVRSVKLNYTMNLIKHIKTKIKLFMSKENNEDNNEMLNKLKITLKELEDNIKCPPVGSDEHINWIRVSEVFIKDKHSYFECRAFWHVYLHPSINKSPWNKEEDQKIMELVKKYNKQSWDNIAKELGTNRTAFTVATHYFSDLHCTYKKGEFTFNEDKKLLELVNKFRMGSCIPWVSIARHFKNRTRTQLYHRFTYYLTQVDKKKGKFTEAEDIIILTFAEKVGGDFRKCTEYLPERSYSQIKSRYTSNLKHYKKKGTWTVDEDKLIMEHAEKMKEKPDLGWGQLALQIHRTRGQIRQRYLVIQAFLKSNPESSVENVTRRKHDYILSAKNDSNLLVRSVVDYFLEQDYVPCLPEVEAVINDLKEDSKDNIKPEPVSDRDVNFNEIDELLTNFFCTAHEEPKDEYITQNLTKTVDEIETVIDLLKVNLDIPENLEVIPYLNSIDKGILEKLKTRKKVGKTNPHIKQLVPVDFHTTSAMRCLLLKYLHFKKDIKILSKEQLPYRNENIFGNFDIPHTNLQIQSDIKGELLELSTMQTKKLKADRNLFYRRFLSIFKWPAILTLEPPSRDLISISQNLTVCSNLRPPVKRTYSRKPVETETEPPKKMRILEGKATDALQLKPITDQSVILNLLTDNSKKLFYVNEVQCGSKTTTQIKEVDLNFLSKNKTLPFIENSPSTSKLVKRQQTTGIKKTSSTNSSETDDGDLLDLEKLTNLIKMEKGSACD